MKKYSFVLISILCVLTLKAQDISLALQKTPRVTDKERTTAWQKLPQVAYVSFASTAKRFMQELPPDVKQTTSWSVKAWKGEKVHTQILVWSKKPIDKITVAPTDMKDSKGNRIAKENISVGFVRYVMTDEFSNGCGYRKSKDFDSSMVADRIEAAGVTEKLEKNTTLPVWVSIAVPAEAKAGIYKGSITVMADKKYTLPVVLQVINRVLPSPDQWTYHLDLWQHPAAIARVHQLPLWSDAHFAAMKKYYTMLAGAGQKVITASIVNEPWGHQTYDDYPSLIKWTKKKDGSWSYDYSLFDKYISFVMDCGIRGRINCYSMVPWKIAFSYYDEALQKDTVFTEAIGTPAYNAFWSSMLTDFTKHLKEKKWFQITTIAMDERPMDAMQSVIKLLKSIDGNWKIALAGDYHPEIENDIFDYCVASRWQFPDDVLIQRKQQGKVSTWYTCCSEKYPNGFSFSPPDEHVWMGWYTAATRMDGYLRWAFNSWTRDPDNDTRFTAWPAGDTYQVYPGPATSIRFEKFIEGVQDFEKIQLLREEYRKTNKQARLNELEAALKKFEIKKLASQSAEDMVASAKHLLNK